MLLKAIMNRGKSTLVYFVKSMLYGIDKNKSGNAFSETERFKPWKDSDFSGKMDYIVDGKKYSTYRDFNRNNSKVFDDDGNEITSEYNKEKSRGVEIGMKHMGIDEETFLNSSFVSQGDVIVESNERRNVIQKLTNIIQSGNESISYDKVQEKLHKKLMEDVGTDRTHNKPINNVKKEIEAFEKTRDELILNRDKKENINDKEKIIDARIQELSDDYESAVKIYEIKERYEKLISEREKEYEISLKVLEKEKEEKIKKKAKLKKTLTTLSTVVSVLAALIILYLKLYIWVLIPLLLYASALIVINKVMSAEIKQNMPQDIVVTTENLRRKEEKELENLKKGNTKESLINRKIPDLKILINGIEKNKNDMILEKHKLKIETEGLSEHINRLNDVEEQLANLYDRKSDIEGLEFSLKLASSKLEEAYEELKESVVPDIEDTIKKNILIATNGKYSNVIYNDELGLMVENPVGDIVSIDKLSTGTIDQMYLGFRFAIAEKVGDVPIFLDEAFAYYDDDRLENILKFLSEKASKSQIFIMTCSNREKEILKKLKLKFNLIEFV